jgi:uncharacterized membrane protein YidH (DUF202 family)
MFMAQERMFMAQERMFMAQQRTRELSGSKIGVESFAATVTG